MHEYPAGEGRRLCPISGEAGKPLTVSFSLICDDLNINISGGVNNNTVLAGLPTPAPAGRVLFRQGQF